MIDNPKHIQALKEGKTPFEFIPLTTLAGAARVLQHGARKYGKRNWLIDEIKASTYQGALMRHLSAYYSGEFYDPESKESHLSHIMANCIVMLDAEAGGTLINDVNDKESINEQRRSSTDDTGHPRDNWSGQFNLEGIGRSGGEQSAGTPAEAGRGPYGWNYSDRGGAK